MYGSGLILKRSGCDPREKKSGSESDPKKNKIQILIQPDTNSNGVIFFSKMYLYLLDILNLA